MAGKSRRRARREEPKANRATGAAEERTAVGSTAVGSAAIGPPAGAPEPVGGAEGAEVVRIDVRGAAVVAAKPFRGPEGSWGLKVGGAGAAVIVARPLRATPLAPEVAVGETEGEEGEEVGEEPLPEGAGWEEV